MTQDRVAPAADGGCALCRRLIAEEDVPALAVRLAAAFPRRREAAWRAGLERLGRHAPPSGLPRYGVLLQAGGRIVGAVLTICAEVEAEAGAALRCHLSSWFIEPAFAAHAPLLIGPLLRRPEVTLVNVSPARHTEPIIERQGFRAFCRGSLMVLPGPGAGSPAGAAMRPLRPADAASPAERQLFETHAAWGCHGLAMTRGDHVVPFIFAPRRHLRGVLPVSQLLYCRDLADFAAHARPLGRALLRRGIVAVMVDAAAPAAGLRGPRVGGRQGRYARGPNPPRPGDLAYSELALFRD